MKLFMELLIRDYENDILCTRLANFGESVPDDKLETKLTTQCSLIMKNGKKYIKNKETLIEMKLDLSEKEKVVLKELIDAGVFDRLKLARWMEPKKENSGITHFWRTGIADDDMQ